MRGVEASGIESVAIVLGIGLLIAASGIRIYIFRNLKGDRAVRGFLADTLPIGTDLLALRLFNSRHSVERRSLVPIYGFFFTQLGGMLLVMLGALHAVFF